MKNEPAFPTTGLHTNGEGGSICQWNPGMTLRDYFAAKAMHSILTTVYGSMNEKEIAKEAYLQADAMLAERAKESK